MTYQEPLSNKAVAISISESSDMASLGLAEEHLRDAMAEIARHLLAMGAQLIYGGDLRAHGFTDLLFELVTRHRRDADVGDPRTGVLSYLAWPSYAGQSLKEVKSLSDELAGIAEFRFLDKQGRETSLESISEQRQSGITHDEWATALTSMRRRITDASNARIILGGRVKGYKGRMPGVAEEALQSLVDKRPLFLMAGFGGCARDIANDIGFDTKPSAAYVEWSDRKAFKSFGTAALNNGLNHSENASLVRTPHIDEAIGLILRGLLRLTAK
jgi:hypothetical protein